MNQGRTPSERVQLHLHCIKNHLAGILRELPTNNMKEKLKAAIPAIKEKAIATLLLLWNKGVAACLLAILAWKYTGLSSDDPTPFAEVLYALILAGTVIVVSPIVRLLVFPNAAEAAEKGDRSRKWLESGNHSPPPSPTTGSLPSSHTPPPPYASPLCCNPASDLRASRLVFNPRRAMEPRQDRTSPRSGYLPDG